ncbi:hypothetical protein [Microtetraspora sp. NBRC 13810]|uniref:hypothetical protein n=1 Tax=Microtetraspora sp. NBRC 13810 TaxID=3030990 RepID=UPI0025551912|nr:hypothetical protein [Microtetraspora sp. NBRC 13810]
MTDDRPQTRDDRPQIADDDRPPGDHTPVTGDRNHHPGERQGRGAVAGRARKRAIRARMALTGVPYTLAARLLDSPPAEGAGTPACRGRTVYPATGDAHRRLLLDLRERRPFAQRVRDARLAADLPRGRAWHLAERFPPLHDEPGSPPPHEGTGPPHEGSGPLYEGTGPLYDGEGRQDVLALLYAMVAVETPALVPSAGDLAWTAELGEETAVDTACAVLDRAARMLLDEGEHLWRRAGAALAAGRAHPHWRTRDEAERLSRALTLHDPLRRATLPLRGARQILDALLVVADDGHAPGTRVRINAGPYAGVTGTITGARWARDETALGAVWQHGGPPRAYEVHPDRAPVEIVADPAGLLVLARTPVPQEA